MNLVVFEPASVVGGPDGDEILQITDRRRLEHLRKVLKVKVGDTLRGAERGGRPVSLTVLECARDRVVCAIRYRTQDPPAKLRLELALALPRPPVLARVLIHAVTLGVERVTLFHAERVERSYWSSSALEAGAVQHALLLGMEQAGDWICPEVSTVERSFRDLVRGLAGGSRLVVGVDPRFCARPGGVRQVIEPSAAVTAVLGPEGGFTPAEFHELAELVAARGLGLGLGPRILRVEGAVIAAVTHVELARGGPAPASGQA